MHPPPNEELSAEYKEEYRNALIQKFRPFTSTDALDLESLASVSYYSEVTGVPLVLGEIPEIVHKLGLANSMTRLQLSNMLNLAGKECVYRPEIRPLTPWMAAQAVFPDIVTAPSDFYAASLIDRLAGRYKRPLILQGGIQSATTPLWLQANDRLDLAAALTPPPWRVSLVEDRFVEDLVERCAILDVMQHGAALFKAFDGLSFKSTYAVMKKFASPDLSKQQVDELRYVHVRLLRKYADQLAAQQVAARSELEKAFLSNQ